MTEELFEKNDDLVDQPDPNKDWEAEFVGDGKKFKDTKALAYSAAVKDSFIERLQKENARLRGEVSQKKTLDDVLTAIEKKAKQPEPVTPTDNKGATEINPQELEKLISERATQAAQAVSKEEKARVNVERVMTTLAETWGPDFKARLASETTKYNLGQEFITNLARERPDALLALLGVKRQEPLNLPKAPQGTIQVQPKPVSGEKTESYYAKMKKENPALYNTPKIQNEMHAQALKLRDAYFDL